MGTPDGKPHIDPLVDLGGVIDSLEDGERRLVIADYCVRGTWFPVQPGTGDEIGDLVLSGAGILEGNTSDDANEIRNEVSEELDAIQALILKDKYPIEPEPGEGNSTEYLKDTISAWSIATTIWDWAAVQIRKRGDRVYRVWTPSDLMGPIVVRSLDVDDYVFLAGLKTAEDSAQIDTLSERVAFRSKLCIWLAIGLAGSVLIQFL